MAIDSKTDINQNGNVAVFEGGGGYLYRGSLCHL